MASIVIDDHLLRDVLVGKPPASLRPLAGNGIATTGLWLFRLSASLARPGPSGRLSGPVAHLSESVQSTFRARLMRLPAEIEVLSLRNLSWSMAVLRERHRERGRPLSAAMVEALAAALALGAGIAVSARDVGPTLRAAADADSVPFHVLAT